MGWFKQITKNIMHKTASTKVEEIKRNALEALDHGRNVGKIRSQFIMFMGAPDVDPNFARSPFVKQLMSAKPNKRIIYDLIDSYGKPKPVMPAAPIDTPITPVDTPIDTPITPVDTPMGADTPVDTPMGADTPVEPPMGEGTTIEPPIGEGTTVEPPMGVDTTVEENIINPQIEEPEIEVVDQIPTGTIPVENTPSEEIEDDVIRPLEPEGQDTTQSFEERLQQDNEELQKEEDTPSIYKNPTILDTWTVSDEQVRKVYDGLENINKKLKKIHHPPINFNYTRNEEPKNVLYGEMEVSGVLPSPTDEIEIKVQKPAVWGKNYTDKNDVFHPKGSPYMERDGITQKMIPVDPIQKGIKIIGRVNHHSLKADEIVHYLTTEPPTSKLRSQIEHKLGLKPGDPPPDLETINALLQDDNKVPFFNTITSMGKRYPWDDKFYFSKSKECYKCKNRRERLSTYIAVVVDPDKLEPRTYRGQDEQGNWIDIPLMITRDMNYGRAKTKPKWEEVPATYIPDSYMDSEDMIRTQEQLGGSCADSYTEIKLMSELETLMAKWSKTSQEIADELAEKALNKKPVKARRNGPGGTRGKVPSEAFFTTIIALLREEGADGKISGRLPVAASNYLDLIDLQDKPIPEDVQPATRARLERQKARRIQRQTELIPNITPDDKKIATDVNNYWKGRFNGLGNNAEDKNKIMLSVLRTIDISNKKLTKNNKTRKNPNIKRAIDMVQTYLTEHNITLPPNPEVVQPEVVEDIAQPGLGAIQPEVGENIVDPGLGQEDVQQGLGQENTPAEEAFLDDMRTVGRGDNDNTFVSKFTHTSSEPYGNGFFHYFTGNDGKKYKIFDNFKKDPETRQLIREPKFNFNDGEEYTLRGTKGKWSGGAIAINNISIISPERLAEHVGVDTP